MTRRKLQEIKTRHDKQYDVTKFSLENVPMQIDLAYSAGGVVTTFDATSSFKTYDGKLSDEQFKKYKKEITALYKDFDDIYSEINAKYKLREE